jgi:hypothetical protein
LCQQRGKSANILTKALLFTRTLNFWVFSNDQCINNRVKELVIVLELLGCSLSSERRDVFDDDDVHADYECHSLVL